MERFWSKVDKSGDCWLWTACADLRGYGFFRYEGKNHNAHRVAYMLANGPIPPGMTVDHRHTCPKNCVNPEHLRLATSKQNNENHNGPSSRNKSGVRGVCWEKGNYATGRWRAQVSHNGKNIHVGYFTDLKEAETTVVAKRLELHTHNDLDMERAS